MFYGSISVVPAEIIDQMARKNFGSRKLQILLLTTSNSVRRQEGEIELMVSERCFFYQVFHFMLRKLFSSKLPGNDKDYQADGPMRNDL